MSPTYIPIITALIAAWVTAGGIYFSRRKNAAEAREAEADAAQTTVASALSLINPLRDRIVSLEGAISQLREEISSANARIDTLRQQVADERREITILQGGIAALEQQVTKLGAVPVFRYNMTQGEDNG